MDIDIVARLQDWSPKQKPLSSQLAEGLARQIRTGQLAAGARLPGEPRLAADLGVSRNTVREAISILREQRLVTTRQGIGTVVLDASSAAEWPLEVGSEQLISTTQLITQAGHKPGTLLTEISTVPTESTAHAYLQLPPTDPLQMIERVRTADEIPVLYCRDYVSMDLIPHHLMAQYRGDESLFGFMQRELDLDVVLAHADILPTLPSARIASLLHVSRRRPLLALHQVHYASNHRPFLYSENYFNPDYIGISVSRAAKPPHDSPSETLP
jgi:GntR family transcriptional regulator